MRVKLQRFDILNEASAVIVGMVEVLGTETGECDYAVAMSAWLYGW